MEPDIFQYDNETCHMVYNDFLVVNLSLNRLDKCMGTLQKGKRYTKITSGGGGFLVSSGYNACHSIKLNKDKFKIQFNAQNNNVRIRKGSYTDELKNINYIDKGFLIDWMINNIKNYRAVNQFDRPVHSSFYILSWFIVVMLVLILFMKFCVFFGVGINALILATIIYCAFIAPSFLIVKHFIKQKRQLTVYIIK